MARSISQIQQSILAAIAANPVLTYVDANNITQPLTNNESMYALFNAFAWIVATAQATFEQLCDAYVLVIEGLIARSAAASQLWLQAQMFRFQYSVSDPQVLQLISGVPGYVVINTALCPVTACSVFTDATNTVQVKFAVGSPLQAATSQQIAAAQTYITEIGGAGIAYNATSLNPDQIFIQAQIFYNGMYAAVIQSNTILALNNYLTNLSITNFDGSLKMSDLEAVIRNVAGVNDVLMQNVYIRRDIDPAPTSTPTGFPLIVNETVQQRIYQPDSIPLTAGYMINEVSANWSYTGINPVSGLPNLNFISQ